MIESDLQKTNMAQWLKGEKEHWGMAGLKPTKVHFISPNFL